MTTTIYVDGDACPVRDEVFRVSARLGLPVRVVSNGSRPARPPGLPQVETVVVEAGADAADDWIAERASPQTVVVTGDILLADRCLKAGAAVISPSGKPFTASSIGNAVAVRAIMADLRAGAGESIGGPAPFSRSDRSRFLSALDEALVRLNRSSPSPR